MGTTEDMHALILKYLHDKHPGKYADMTEQQLSFQPYHKQVWTWWQAPAYYGLQYYYTSLDKAPEGVGNIHVIEGEEIFHYQWKNGKYVYLQRWTKEACRGVYGDKTPGT